MMAPDSQSVRLVFGSWIAGTRPLTLMLVKGAFFISAMSKEVLVCEREEGNEGRANP